MELAATLHMLLETYREHYGDWTMADVIDHLRFLKPWATEAEIVKALDLLRVLRLADSARWLKRAA